jgi:hypothetical protein
MLRRAPNFTVGNWDSTSVGFTSVVRTGLAAHHTTSLRA